MAQALAAINTTVNRVTGIFERDLSIRLTLVANNDQIIFTDPTRYSNNNGFAMLNENQAIIDSIIGNANYDIGHVFSTGEGGVARRPSVCRDTIKAQGVTGRPEPIGDAFDVDFVAHEMGHQFGANHTFNADGNNVGSCGGGNRNDTTGFEPGGGSTIMAYAGICLGQDLQSQSDDYFHAASIDEIIDNVTAATGSTCGTETATGNAMPTAVAGADYTIPRQTPFLLNGTGNDTAGDTLTFGWEEFDAGAAWTNATVLPNTDADGNARAIFRSFKPAASSTRTFPALASILDGSNRNSGESLPTIDRTMRFRLTVRDGKGGVNHNDMTVRVESGAGPFEVTSPNTALNWDANSQQTITWNVANTSAAPVSCTNVHILISTDGGNTFPTTLALNTPNDGSAIVTLPNQATALGRVKVECAGNIFFDISNANFSIGPAVPVGPRPDLVVKQLVATGNSVQVVIENQGAAAVPQGNGFWVDVYIDPTSPPTKPNEIWNFLADEGLVWGVDGVVLPMEPGEVITLTLGNALYWPTLSNLAGAIPAGTPIYAQVDSANTNTNYGGVLESHETGGGAYNNVAGPAIIAVNRAEQEIYLPLIDGSTTATASDAESQVASQNESNEQDTSESMLPSRTQNETEE